VINGIFRKSEVHTKIYILCGNRISFKISYVPHTNNSPPPPRGPAAPLTALYPLAILLMTLRSRGSSGSIVSDYGLDDRVIGVRSPAGSKDFSSNLCVHTSSGAHPASVQWVPGALSPGVKARPGRDANHSPPSSAEIVNE
jgi:hypothetical protein